MMLVASTGTWKYLASSFFAHDLQRAVAWEHTDMPQPRVVVVAISDAAFDGYFGGRSPLDRGRLLEVLKALDATAGAAKGIVIDLDLAPLAGREQKELFDLFTKNPSRWILADPVLRPTDDTPTRAAWRSKLCQAGVRIGLPYLPTEFGYVSGSHQYRGSLTDVALDAGFDCQRLKSTVQNANQVDGTIGLSRYSAPMSGGYIKQGWVVPFDGNLESMQQTVAAMQPQWVVLGGMWGTGDVLNSPMGERYGVQLHAAALDGQLQGEFQVAYIYQIVAAWISLAIIIFPLTFLYRILNSWTSPWFETYPGHLFLMKRVWPVLFTAIVFSYLLAVSEVLAIVHARWNCWIPTATVAGSVLGYLMLVWNWGMNSMVTQVSVRTTLRNSALTPFSTDWSGAKAAYLQAWRGSNAVTQDSDAPVMSRARCVVEGTLALLSLVVQTVLPLASLFFALSKTL